MRDMILLPELRQINKSIKEDLENKESENYRLILNHMKLLFSLSIIARQEGILELEEAMNKIDDVFLRELILLVVDGTEPEVIQRTMLVKYFADEQSAVQSIRNIMSIYAMLEIQAGTVPWVMLGILENMTPVEFSLTEDENQSSKHWYETYKERRAFINCLLYDTTEDASKKESLKKDALNQGTLKQESRQEENDRITDLEFNIEEYCKNDFLIKENKIGYFETKICGDILLSMDDRAVQCLLSQHDYSKFDLKKIMEVFSGKCREHIFKNMSKNNARELALELEKDITQEEIEKLNSNDYWLSCIKDASVRTLKKINYLEKYGEFNLPDGAMNNFLEMIIHQIDCNQKAEIERKKDCELLIKMIENYKRGF